MDSGAASQMGSVGKSTSGKQSLHRWIRIRKGLLRKADATSGAHQGPIGVLITHRTAKNSRVAGQPSVRMPWIIRSSRS